MVTGLIAFVTMICAAYFAGRIASNNKNAADMADAVLKADQKKQEIHNEVSKEPITDLVNSNNKRFNSGDKS
jgi:hypothetical protein